jgi:hypothetical protein
MRLLPAFGEAALRGDIGVAQMHALAAVVANPRVRHHLESSESLLVSHAQTLEHDDFITFLQRWESLADEDGARQRHERAHLRRHASLHVIDEYAMLRASGGAAAGVLMREIFERFTTAEWMSDWHRGVQQHGEKMNPSLMERTDQQRSFDALLGIFRSAAGSGAVGGDIVVNVLVDQQTFERHVGRALGQRVPPADPADVARTHTETDRGDVLHGADIVIAACIGHVRRVVLDSAGVVLDMGRRQRLFTGPLREAVLLAARRCLWPGCSRPASQCEADHLVPYARWGPTSTPNGGPGCGHHNRWKNSGYRTWRDANGNWHVYRPDATRIGWAIDHVTLAA